MDLIYFSVFPEHLQNREIKSVILRNMRNRVRDQTEGSGCIKDFQWMGQGFAEKA